MYAARALPYAVTLALAVPTAGFLVRTFIVAHDCAHGSFFRSPRLANGVGRLCAALAFVPYRYWQRMHAAHHATAGKLDRRGMDVETLTVREYQALSPRGQLRYRLLRHPLVLFGLAPFLYFALALRLPGIAPAGWRRERRSILLTDLALAGGVAAAAFVVGLPTFLAIQLPVTLLASTVGMWLFYVQHQFEDGYWARDGEWDYGRAALEGSSYLVLPPPLAWFTGYIGLHHVHHLSPRVPSYRLAACVAGSALLADVPRIGLADGLRASRLKLWDEDSGRLVGWPAGG
jgi:omega-6 fatty acid desaturase (delta-12 desaturase)